MIPLPKNQTINLFLPFNSDAWLQGPRYNNSNSIDDALIDNDHVQRTILNLPQILDHISPLLEQTLAVQGSQFLQPSNSNASDVEMVRLWIISLQYLVIHVHQHLPALPEAQKRQQHNMEFQKLQQKHNIGTFDYEYPKTNFLLTNLPDYGIGATVYWSMQHALKAGLAINRVVTFVKELPEKNPQNKPYIKGWQQASCPRKDYQCTFAPLTPCVPTIQDLQQGYQLNQTELKDLYANGILPPHRQHHKVIFAVPTRDDYLWIPIKRMGQIPDQKAQKIALQLLQTLPPNDSRIPILKQAIDGMTWANGRKLYGNDHGTLEPMRIALTAYSLRPRPTLAQTIRQYVQDSLPPNYQPHTTVGLPIRATDKCLDESECLTFSQHMDVVQAEWTKLPFVADTMPTAIIFTTESQDMIVEQQQYQKQKQKEQPPSKPIAFITNQYDILPNTGAYRGEQADEALVSALTSLGLQLHSRLIIANCCSNFARLLQAFFEAGMSIQLPQPLDSKIITNTNNNNNNNNNNSAFVCLQDVDDPRYRPCCWKKAKCLEEKEEAIQIFLKQKQQERPRE